MLACAQAEANELGWFSAVAVREPLNKIVGGTYDVPAYVRHLSAFTTDGRGKILETSGVSHRFRFRFANPLMQPFVILRGYADGKISGA